VFYKLTMNLYHTVVFILVIIASTACVCACDSYIGDDAQQFISDI
jgi:hypothetical protein